MMETPFSLVLDSGKNNTKVFRLEVLSLCDVDQLNGKFRLLDI